MPTRLSRFCDGLMEAGWLLAVVVVPLFFNVYSSRVFEPDKLALLRSIALVVSVAWLVKVVAEGGFRLEQARWRSKTDTQAPPAYVGPIERLSPVLRLPLIAPVAAFLASLLLSTALSITPRVSFFGSYQRLQGTYTTLAYLVLFGSLLANLRRRAQLERLLTTTIVASLPVSLFALLQRFELDPLPWGGDTTTRVSSSMGNAIFLGAYLIMVLPVTLGRVVESFTAIARPQHGLRLSYDMIRATVYVLTASVQLVALWYTGSRGPWLGFLAGLFFLAVLFTSYWRLRGLTIGAVGLAAALGGFLVALNVPGGPLEPLRSTPALGRLGHVFETEQATGLVRVLIWQGASELALPHAPLEYPDGRTDAFNVLRPLAGFGPEAMYVAFNRFYPPELGQVERRTASPDRSHNETWDALVTTGLIGLVVYLALFASVFYYGLKWLGLMQTPTQRRLFLALYAGGGLAGAAGMVLWRGLPFFGVGLPFGIMLGLIVYLAWLALFLAPAEGAAAGRPEPWRAAILIGLIAALMAHFTEIHFGIAIAASRTLFWLFAGLMAVVGMGLLSPDESAPEERRKKRDEAGRKRPARANPASAAHPAAPALASAGVTAVGLAVFGFDFINNPYRLASGGAVVWQSLTSLPRAGGATSLAVLTVVCITWLTGCLLLAAEPARLANTPPAPGVWARRLGTTLAVSALMALLYWRWIGGAHARLSAGSINTEAELLAAIGRLNGLLTALYLVLGALMVWLAAVLPESWPVPSGRRGTAGAWLAGLLGVAAVAAAYSTNLRVTHADIIFKTAEGYAGANNWEAATRLYLQASDFAPNEDYYYLFVGKGYLQVADLLADPARQAAIFEQARQRLQAAQTLNPLNIDHTANLGRLYRWWASVAPDESERRERAAISDEYYARALTLAPNSALLWNEWASLDLTFLDDPAGALEKIEHSLELDPKFDRTYALLGDFHANQARRAGGRPASEAEYHLAAEAYMQAVELVPTDLNSRLALGAVYSTTGEVDQAIEWYSGAIEYAPPEANLVNIYRALTDLHRRAGAEGEALRFAELALANAPEEMRAEIQRIIQELRGS